MWIPCPLYKSRVPQSRSVNACLRDVRGLNLITDGGTDRGPEQDTGLDVPLFATDSSGFQSVAWFFHWRASIKVAGFIGSTALVVIRSKPQLAQIGDDRVTAPDDSYQMEDRQSIASEHACLQHLSPYSCNSFIHIPIVPRHRMWTRST